MLRNNFTTRRKNNTGYYGTRKIWIVWIDGHSSFTRCGLLLIDVLFLPAKYTFICMNIKSTETVPYPYSYDAGLVRDSTIARLSNNYYVPLPKGWGDILFLVWIPSASSAA